MTFHMSVTKQEANFLKDILAKHLDDYVEELVRADKDKPLEIMMKNRDIGKSLIEKASEVKRRATKKSDTPYFTNWETCAIIGKYLLDYHMTDEVLDKVTVDIPKKRFTLLSSDGNVKTLDCDDGDQFMRVLDVVRNSCLNNEVVYV